MATDFFADYVRTISLAHSIEDGWGEEEYDCGFALMVELFHRYPELGIIGFEDSFAAARHQWQHQSPAESSNLTRSEYIAAKLMAEVAVAQQSLSV